MDPRTSCLLFDLDGTLLDTALDLVGALNAVLRAEGRVALDPGPLRRLVSRGGRRLLQEGFPELDEAGIERLLPAFLAHYANDIARHTRAYDGIEALLTGLDQQAIPWAIVTNKPIGLTRLLLDQLGWSGRTPVVVGGDTLAQRKPHPAPLLHAMRSLGHRPETSWMIGDDERDVQAGIAAGCRTVVAGWGYLDEPERVPEWGADDVLDSPAALIEMFLGAR
jgi:N-acetyl-D-muramate 6-phosphate phosphatase